MNVLLVHSGNAVSQSSDYTFVKEQGEALKSQGVNVFYFAVRGKGVRGYLSSLPALKSEIKKHQIDLVHAHYGFCGALAVLQRRVPVIITFHNGETLNWHVNLLSSLFSLRAKHVIYVAQHVRDLSYFKAKNYSIIPCGVSLEDCVLIDKDEARKKLGWDLNKKYILFGGAFVNLRKNYALLRDAVERIGGDIEVVEMKGLSRAECVLHMCASDLFALPSHSEGSPQALKEAMACNCPCLATDIADVRELFGDEPGHWILRNPRKTHERWDADDKSLDEMVALLKEALAFEGRTNGRKKIEELQLTNEAVAKRIINIYNEILK